MSVSDRTEAPNRPGEDAAIAVWRHRDAIALTLTMAVALGLTGLVSRELTGSSAPATTQPGVQLGSSPPQPSATPDLARALPDGLLARPPFAASRHPALIDPAAPTAIARDEPPQLVGTLMTGRHDRTALLAVANLPKLQAVHEGDTLGRYRIIGIAPGEIRAEGPAGPVTLRLSPRQREAEHVQPSPVEAPHNAPGAPDQDE